LKRSDRSFTSERLSTGWNSPDSGDVAAHITLIQPLFPTQAVARDPGPRSHAPPRQDYWDWTA
jgi:hypothetical protein